MVCTLGSTPQKTLDQTDDNDTQIIERLLPEPRLEEQPELHIHITIPSEFQTYGKYNIGITRRLETIICPPTMDSRYESYEYEYSTINIC